jgi:anthranilate synthase component 1
MQIEPPERVFADIYGRGEAQVVWTTLVADLETPVSAFLKLGGGKPMSFLLESVEGGAVRGRYSIIGIEPDLIWRADGTTAEINRSARSKANAFVDCTEPPLQALRALISESRIELPSSLPPMAAGVFGYLGYDVVRRMEELAAPNPDLIGIPDAVLVRPTIIVVFDAVKDSITIVTPVRPEKNVDAKTALARAVERLARVVESLDRPLDKSLSEQDAGPIDAPAKSKHDTRRIQDDGAQGKRIHRRRRCVPSRARTTLRGAIYAAAVFTLPRAPSDKSVALFVFPRLRTICRRGIEPRNSCQGFGDVVTIRPIAGTRPRGATPHEDKMLEEELLADPKERAEHLMLLDLGRNDVGRVAGIGTVKVTDQFFIERYSHVMHIVSNVEGKLAGNRDALDALVAGFPAGTVSGAPKVRAMQIIDELEKEKRGLYAGCVGYFSAAGEMDTCIVLRTALVKDGKMYVQAGAGIVADSDPDFEQQECINKAKGFVSGGGRGPPICQRGQTRPVTTAAARSLTLP